MELLLLSATCTVTGLGRRLSISSHSKLGKTGRRKCAPMAARSTFGSHTSTQPANYKEGFISSNCRGILTSLLFCLTPRTFREQDIVAASGRSTSQHCPEVARVSDVVAYQGQWHRILSASESNFQRIGPGKYSCRVKRSTSATAEEHTSKIYFKT